jgi:tRNA U34 2-thiouridine synthase MnmA/TrmU
MNFGFSMSLVTKLKPKVIVGMSSGVDSAVSALLLLESGYDVEGVYMNNWDHRNETDECPTEKEWKSVQDICKTLEIKCQKVRVL